ncbi:transglycosylase domain-containing protein [Qipengyuania marisflavi]|uniref:Penicillin-binding protein n=1 Tax=Qipengyuania marisflavi TaxID=2486356 RepID=A0A5S3P6Q0_9SPHN|nr:transglycosylase domain-containing protein [Qipengyuania marisflavi]TMM48908.1 penicillin-binding protein [Qipengyuania marisflavi]
MTINSVTDWLYNTAWPWLRDRPLRYTLLFAFLIVLLAWETAAAPPWRMGETGQADALEFLAADDTVIARRGNAVPEPIEAGSLPPHVRNAFIAIEDRRFFDHGGLDLRGLARAMLANAQAGGVVEGGSTITQQYVKNAYLTQDRTFARKLKEVVLADWVEVWMGKDDILSGYLEAAYYGDGQNGLAAAARHYFDRAPADLTLGQSALLAGMLKAPSNLAPTVDREASLERMRIVLSAMADAEFITAKQAEGEPDPRVTHPRAGGDDVPGGSWFTDWLAQGMDDNATGQVKTTLDAALQAQAEQAVAAASLGSAEVALIAIRPDGRVVAMVGGKEWQAEAFNRALFAERQPGSTFKLFDYLAAFRDGATPDDTMLDGPLNIDGWQPKNAYSGYRGAITIREAFAISSNTVAVRAAQTAGYDEVRKAARDLGVHSELTEMDSLPLGTSNMTLAELVTAYAAFAGGRYPVTLYGIEDDADPPSEELDRHGEWIPMLDLLWQAANAGTGKRAVLAQPTFGKTGTSQDGRDSLFVGFAGNLVTAVWVGRDDNDPIPGNSGGHVPAQIWNAFMSGADLEPMDLPFNANGASTSTSTSTAAVSTAAAGATAAAAATTRKPPKKRGKKRGGKGRKKR